LSSFHGYIGRDAGATGAALITGAGSKWSNSRNFYVGSFGTATLNIEDGGAVVSGSTGYIGNNYGSIGTATVTGAGSKWLNGGGALYVGRSGSGTLNVTNGGLVTSSEAYVGDNSTSTATISGGGSKWANGNYMYVGYSGCGTLTIDNGAQVTGGIGYLGYAAGASGAAIVTGTGSTWALDGALFVGRSGAGTLTVESGAVVTTKTLYASLNDLKSAGNGTINANGLVSDMELAFDGSYGTSRQFPFGSGGVLNLNVDGSAVLGAGHKGSGALRISNGRAITSSTGYLGCVAGSSGTATVTGTGSRWTTAFDLYVGDYGAGTLNVENGGQANSARGYLGSNHGSTGVGNIGGTGSRWTNGGYLYVGRYGAGELNIKNGGQVTNTRGRVGDGADSSGTVTVAGAGSTWTNSESLYVGYMGRGALVVESGGQVSNMSAYLASLLGSAGTAHVAGNGSRWTCNGYLNVGDSGSGALTIEAGGQVSNATGYLGYQSSAAGTATVTGPGSRWANSSALYVGNSGAGTLYLEAGGQVTAASIAVKNGASTLNAHVSNNNMLVLGTASTPGAFTNNGKTNFYADGFLTAGTYAPVSDLKGRTMTWSGTGTYNAFGGMWDSANKTFVVPAAAQVAASGTASLATGMRTIFTDPAGRRAGVSTGVVPDGTTLSASPLAGGDLSGISLLPGESVVSAWDFTTPLTGETLLSFDVGGGLSDLRAWRYDGTVWSPYDTHVVYRDGIASFTVTGFSGYAVSAVPEPGTWAMLAAGVAAVVLYWQRKRRA
jgi:T5SS/PEP-CTERM-associated repeat protein